MNRLAIAFLATMIASACSKSGEEQVNGFPASLEQHARIACTEGYREVESSIAQARGQQKKDLQEEVARYSRDQVCGCTVRTALAGTFSASGVEFNKRLEGQMPALRKAYAVLSKHQQGELSEVSRSKAVFFQAQEIFEAEKTPWEIRQPFIWADNELRADFARCLAGFDPATVVARPYE